jgi:hypothetical protein
VSGTAGAASGWDLINGSGTLDITAVDGLGTDFIIDITSLTALDAAGALFGFVDSSNYSWMIADFANAVTGFTADKFTINTTDFATYNSFTGVFAVALGESAFGGDNTQIWLTYTAIPEPRSDLLVCVGLLLLLRRRR